MSKHALHSVIGIEIEYMLVNKDTLDVAPKSDVILQHFAGHVPVSEVSLGDIAISNEFVMHVIELKNNGPKPPDAPLVNQFQAAILKLQPILDQYHLQLLPTGAHPWMNPATDTKRWPYGSSEIYNQYDAIFKCQGHGWTNLQSMHVNLPFANEKQFSQLHNSIRLLLPILPALAASTPFLSHQKTGFLDSRLHFYGGNQQRIPSISGDIIPPFISSEMQYQTEILQPMYRDIKDLDPDGILAHEWLNSRAAIAKFDVMAIEIRILDSQECVRADIAIAKSIHAILKYWDERGFDPSKTPIYSTKKLKAIYENALVYGLEVVIDDSELLAQWQLPATRPMSLRHVWEHLIDATSSTLDRESLQSLAYILQEGNLSERILRACGNDLTHERLIQIYRQLGDCLMQNQQFQIS